MLIVKTVSELRAQLEALRSQGKRIGLVPTMGALHEGHLSLVELARERADYAVMTIFVNPIQFNNSEDLAKYPRTFQTDLAKAEAAGVNLLFAPDESEIYPEGIAGTRVLAGECSLGLCGATRPGHFDGVVTVVSILFNLVNPDIAVFGEKDFQQLRVIQQLVRDLHFGVEIISGPIVRDEDGLAMSSRNLRLSPEERYAALYIPRSLQKASELVAGGERDAERLIANVRENLEKPGTLRVDYVEIVDIKSLKPVKRISGEAQLLVAAFAGPVRLIDNIRLNVNKT